MSLITYSLASGQKVKLGKAPARHDSRTLQLAKYLPATAIPHPPAKEDWEKKVKSWPMMLNDNIGDCTCACAGHMIEQWTTYTGAPVTPSDQDVLKAYEAVGHYNPSDPSTDQGAVILDVLNYWRQTGVGAHQIMAYAALEPKNHNEVKDSILLFGNCYIGVQLPLSAQNQAVGLAQHPGTINGERLKKALVGIARIEARFFELLGYIVRGLINAVGLNATPFAFVRGKERDVFAQPL